jgi:ATP phosphoribosyltransferase
LVASLSAAWGERARMSARTVLSRIAAEETARTTREVRALLPNLLNTLPDLAKRFEAHILWNGPVLLAADESTLNRQGTMPVLRCSSQNAFALVDALLEQGAVDVSVSEASYVFEADNPLVTKLLQRIG